MHDRWNHVLSTAAEPTVEDRSLLAEIGFHDVSAAWRRLSTLRARAPQGEATEACLWRLLMGLWESPAPDAALVTFERYLSQVADPAAAMAYLTDHPRAVDMLVKLFGASEYLAETLLRNPEYLLRLTQQRRLSEVLSREEFVAGAWDAAANEPDLPGRWDALRRYQRWEVLRIGACDLFGLMDLRTTTNQLSLLADGLVRAVLEMLPPGPEQQRRGFCVLALGKLGGEELNYSSDIDLVFLADERPELWTPLAQGLIRALQNPTSEGFLYRVDMRLRPWGRSGVLVSTVEGFLSYLRRDAEQWERQALLKARVIAGDELLGARVLAECQPILFSAASQQVRDSVRAAKQRIEAALVREGRTWGEVKSGLGSLRDIEFITQTLQLIHGGRVPQIRTSNTLDGLVRLADFGLLPADEYRQLSGGYLLLRTIEHALQLMHNRAVHALPTDRRELTYLARRLDFYGPDEFVAHYERHITAVRAIFDRHLNDRTDRHTAPVVNASDARRTLGDELPQFSEEEHRRHREGLLQISPERPVSVSAELLEGPLWRVTVLGIDHPGDLSMICGLFFVYGCDIIDGLVTTGEHPEVWSRFQSPGRKRGEASPMQRDLVDVFTVRPPCDSTEPEVWINYEADLLQLLQLSHTGREGEAQGRLAKRVAAALADVPGSQLRLSPLEVALDNESLPHATVMHIRGEDSIGFLYELTNALALTGIQIERMAIRSHGARVSDTLYVTNARDGSKLQDPARQRELQAAVVLIKHFTHLLPRAPNPEAALLHFRSFVSDLFRQPDWPEQLSSLERPEVLGALAQLLGVSDFLWEDFLRLQSASLFPLFRDLTALHTRKNRKALETELQSALARSATSEAAINLLNAFKDREMFRVDMRHILEHIAEFEQFSEELTDVAEVVVAAAWGLVLAELQQKYGVPCDAGGLPVSLCVAALGKCGGREMGFASDIELMFVYATDGQTDGASPLSNATFFQRAVERFMQTIRAPREGVFHVDLRLRPYGRAGQLAVSLAAFEHYFAPQGPAWPYERQALVKLRPIAGDCELGCQLMAVRDRLIYRDSSCDIAAVRAMRERQVRQLVRAGSFNAKLSPGGVVDLEYLVQLLQLQHGHQTPALRTPNTLAAAKALEECGILTSDDHRRLREAYIFFRRLIDALRMVRGNARDLATPPPGSEEFEFLARRLGYTGLASQLKAHIEEHSRNVLALVRRYLTDQTSPPSTSPASARPVSQETP